MLNFILVAGYNNLESVDTMDYCKGRMEEHISTYKRKNDLHFYFVDFKLGLITLQKVAKGGKKSAEITLKKFADLTSTLAGGKKEEIAKIIKADDITDLIISLDKASLKSLEFFYTHANDESDLPLIFYQKGALIHQINFTDANFMRRFREYDELYFEIVHSDGETWLWNLKPYQPKKYFDQNTMLKIEPYLKLSNKSYRYYDENSEIPIKIFSEEELEILLKYITIYSASYERYSKYDPIEGVHKTHLEWEHIDRENGVLPFSFLQYFLLPEGALVALLVERIVYTPLHCKIGTKKLDEDKLKKLVYLPKATTTELLHEHFFNFKQEKTHNFSALEYTGISVRYDKSPLLDTLVNRPTKTQSIYLLKFEKQKIEPAYSSTFKIDLKDFHGIFMPSAFGQSKILNYVILTGIPFRQNFNIPLEYAQVYLGKIYDALNFEILKAEHVQSILSEFKKDEGIIVFTYFSMIDYGETRDLFFFSPSENQYAACPISFFTMAPHIVKKDKAHRIFQGKKFQFTGGSFYYEEEKYHYYHSLEDNDKSIILKKDGSDIIFTITDEFRDILYSLEIISGKDRPEYRWEAVNFPREYKERKQKLDHLNDQIPTFIEREYNFQNPNQKKYRLMRLDDVYLFIKDIGLNAPGSLQKLIFICETNDMNPVLLNDSKRELPQYNFIPSPPFEFYEPGSKLDLLLIDLLADSQTMKAWADNTSKVHFVFGRGSTIYLKIIKSIINSTEYKSGKLNTDSIITLHSPSRSVKKYLEGVADLNKDPSSTTLKIRYKLSSLLKIFADLIVASYPYLLAKTIQRPVITCLPGLGMNIHGKEVVIEKIKRNHQLKKAPQYTNKYATFYERHFGIKRADAKILDENSTTKYPFIVINSNNNFMLDPTSDWFINPKQETKF